MSNIKNSDKKLYAVVHTKEGLRRIEVKTNSSNYKIALNMGQFIEQEARRKKNQER